jgi:signal transduction histidine kinase
MPEDRLPENEDAKAGAGAPGTDDVNRPRRPGWRIADKLTTSGPFRALVIAVFAISLIALIVILTMHFTSGYFSGQSFFWAILAGALLLLSAAGVYVVLKQKMNVLSVSGMLERREQANRRLALLLEAGRELGSSLDSDDILTKTLEYTVGGTGADLGAVFLADRQAGTLDLAKSDGVDEQKMMFKQLPIGKGLIGEAAAARRMLVIDDTASIDDRDNVFYGAATARSQVIVPLVSREKFNGMLLVARKHPHRYSEEEKALLRGLAELASLAITNAQLYRIARRSLDVAAQQRGFADSVLDQMVAGVMTADRNGRVAVFNEEAQRLTGYAYAERTQMMLRPELSIDINPLGPLEQGMLDVLTDPTQLREGDALIMKKDGSILPVSFRVYPLQDGVEVIGSAAVFMESRSGSKEFAREDMDYQVLLRSLGARIERLYTHPLSRVLDKVKGMDVDSWSRSRNDVTKILDAGSAALMGLLEDVEQYLNCITTREWDTKEEHGLQSMINEVVDNLVRSGLYEGVVVLVNLPRLPGVFGYGRLIKTALEEVIENAMVASRESGKKVEVTGREVNGMVRIEVRDSGPGIPQVEKDAMFRPFFTAREGTSGLGLSIVERVMERVGGSIGVTEAAEGALFFLEFPKVKGRLAPEEAGAGGVGAEGERS